MTKTVSPTKSKRVEVIDALRGFAILGILFANILSWSGVKFMPFTELQQFPSFDTDLIIYNLNGIFVDTKFYTIFSLLFGIGFFIQFNKNRENQKPFMTVYYRRLRYLMLFGLIHMFFWSGDILFIYGLVGFIFVQFRNIKPSTLFVISFFAFILPLLIDIIIYLISPGLMVPPEKLALKTYLDMSPEEVTQPFRDGSFWDVTKMNFHNLKWRFYDLLPSGRLFKIFAFFSLGFWMMCNDYFTKRAHSVKLMLVFLVVGLGLTLLSKQVGGSMSQFASNWNDILYKFLFSFGQLNLAFGYISILSICYKSELGKKLMFGLTYVGRMSFSSYLSHTIFGIIIFYPYCFGLFGSMSLWEVEVLAILIYVVQIIFAVLWLKVYSFGPLEWLWRSLTYGKFLSMKKKWE